MKYGITNIIPKYFLKKCKCAVKKKKIMNKMMNQYIDEYNDESDEQSSINIERYIYRNIHILIMIITHIK